MRTAVFADLHDNYVGLTAVLDDAQAQQVDRFIFLGGAGHQLRILAALQAQNSLRLWELGGQRPA